jgi:hypothetical protein
MHPSSPISEAGFATRKELLAKFKEGWRLLDGHPYRSDDWAILVVMPTYPKPVPLAEMLRWVRRFEPAPKPPAISNHSAASKQAGQRLNAVLWERKRAALARAEAMA